MKEGGPCGVECDRIGPVAWAIPVAQGSMDAKHKQIGRDARPGDGPGHERAGDESMSPDPEAWPLREQPRL